MKIDEFCEFLSLAITKDKKDTIFKQYLAILPLYLQGGKYISFEQFYDEFTGANVDWRPKEEILKEVEEIEKSFKEKHDGS